MFYLLQNTFKLFDFPTQTCLYDFRYRCLKKAGTAYPSQAPGLTTRMLVMSVLLISMLFCCVVCFILVLFVFVRCPVFPILPGSLDSPFFIVLSVFSNIWLWRDGDYSSVVPTELDIYGFHCSLFLNKVVNTSSKLKEWSSYPISFLILFLDGPKTRSSQISLLTTRSFQCKHHSKKLLNNTWLMRFLEHFWLKWKKMNPTEINL